MLGGLRRGKAAPQSLQKGGGHNAHHQENMPQHHRADDDAAGTSWTASAAKLVCTQCVIQTRHGSLRGRRDSRRPRCGSFLAVLTFNSSNRF